MSESDEQNLPKRLNLEVEMIGTNRLTLAGNRAQELGLIDGHGFRGGKYEVLRQGKFLIFTPQEAQTYLENLVKEVLG